jgi:hypothetical protein
VIRIATAHVQLPHSEQKHVSNTAIFGIEFIGLDADVERKRTLINPSMDDGQASWSRVGRIGRQFSPRNACLAFWLILNGTTANSYWIPRNGSNHMHQPTQEVVPASPLLCKQFQFECTKRNTLQFHMHLPFNYVRRPNVYLTNFLKSIECTSLRQ